LYQIVDFNKVFTGCEREISLNQYNQLVVSAKDKDEIYYLVFFDSYYTLCCRNFEGELQYSNSGLDKEDSYTLKDVKLYFNEDCISLPASDLSLRSIKNISCSYTKSVLVYVYIGNCIERFLILELDEEGYVCLDDLTQSYLLEDVETYSNIVGRTVSAIDKLENRTL